MLLGRLDQDILAGIRDKNVKSDSAVSDIFEAENPITGDPAIAVNYGYHTSVACSPKGALDCVDAWGTDFREDLKRIDVPALVIHGDADRIVPLPNSGKRMPALVKGSKLVVIEGGPHGIAWTHSDQVNQELLQFLGKASRDLKSA